jgi:hypothetical protein
MAAAVPVSNEIWFQTPDPGEEVSGVMPLEVGNIEDFYLLDNDGIQHPLKALRLIFSYQAENKQYAPIAPYEPVSSYRCRQGSSASV